MSDTIATTTPTYNPFNKYIPLVTAICCLASIVLFIGINLEQRPFSWVAYKKWGYLSSEDIFNGDYWGLITANFLHVNLWDVGFGISWLWVFGKKIEFEGNKFFYPLLILSSALASSLSQLSFSETTGVGLGGIVYSLFGFILIKSKTSDAYKNYLSKWVIYLFILWLVLCIVLTKTKVWIFAMEANIGGLCWGVALAYLSKLSNSRQWIIGCLLLFVLTSSIFWNPFSTSWLSHQAYKLHQDQKVDEAMYIYKKILRIDSDNEFAKSNLQQLEVHQLQEKAFRLHSNKQYQEARRVYNQILTIDKDNQWAKDNLKLLPAE